MTRVIPMSVRGEAVCEGEGPLDEIVANCRGNLQVTAPPA
jgi:hypothetical protein